MYFHSILSKFDLFNVIENITFSKRSVPATSTKQSASSKSRISLSGIWGHQYVGYFPNRIWWLYKSNLVGKYEHLVLPIDH